MKETNKLKEAIKYFKSKEGYNRLFKGMKNKYISLGEIKGNIIIQKPTNIEKQHLSGLMRKDYSKNSAININLKKFKQIIDESKFEGIELTELLKGYFNEDILTKKQNIENYQNDLQLFWKEILKQNEGTYIYNYLIKSIKNKDILYQNIKKYYNKKEKTLKEQLLNACKCINKLPKTLTRIPVFASTILSNPHGIDKKTLCGKLFILLLCYTKNTVYPKNSEELSELYYNNNLLVDDISSMVLCKNIEAYTKSEKHLGLSGFYKYNEPIFLTLYNLINLKYINEENPYKKVVILENPAVFMGIAQKCKIKDFPLICTYGQVKLAGIMLIDLLIKAGYELYYSGDLDPEGIQIADRLKQSYKEKLNFIGFNKETYYKNISDVYLPDSRLQKLASVKSEELKSISEEIKKNKRAAYEEKNIDNIISFIETICANLQ